MPAAVFRLLALAACLAYATSSSRSAIAALREVGAAIPVGAAALCLQGLVVVGFHVVQASFNYFAALVVLHRLYLQSTEDDRAWVMVRQRRIEPRASRRDVHSMV